MKIDFVSRTHFVFNKKDLKENSDYEIVADLISMIYNSYCIDSLWKAEDIKAIEQNEETYQFYDNDGQELQLVIKSLKHKVDIIFLFDQNY